RLRAARRHHRLLVPVEQLSHGAQVGQLRHPLAQGLEGICERGIHLVGIVAWPARLLCDHCSMWRRPESIKLMDLFGFRIGVNRSWFLILFLMIFLLSGDFRSV